MTYKWTESIEDVFPLFVNQLADPTVDGKADENAQNNCGMALTEAHLLYATGVRIFADEIKDAILGQDSAGLTTATEIRRFLGGAPHAGQSADSARATCDSRIFLPTAGNAPDGRTGVFNLVWGALHEIKKSSFCLTRYAPGSSVMHWRSFVWESDLDVDLHETYGGGLLSAQIGHRPTWAEFMHDYYVQPDPAIGSCFVIVDRRREIESDTLMGWDLS